MNVVADVTLEIAPSTQAVYLRLFGNVNESKLRLLNMVSILIVFTACIFRNEPFSNER